MKGRYFLMIGAGLLMLTASSCGPLVTSGPDVAIGGALYPAPLLNPGPGNPNVFRPGAPNGPGFKPGNLGGGAPAVNPGGGNPGGGNPGGGNPGGGPSGGGPGGGPGGPQP